MARRLFFVDAVREDRAELRGEQAHHLTRVLRVEPGRLFEISDNDSVFLAEVESARGDRVAFRVKQRRTAPAPPVRITLAASLFKFERFEWMIEKATELGAERIVPVAAARSDKGLERAAAKRLERWRKIVLESCQQARRPRLASIDPPEPFERTILREADWRYFLDESREAGALVPQLPPEGRTGATVALLIGPEGGWTGAERSAALAAGWRPVSLGRNILRAETAAAAALAVVMNFWPPEA